MLSENYRITKRFITVTLFLLCVNSSTSQNRELSKVYIKFRTFDFKNLKNQITNTKLPKNIKSLILWQSQLYKTGTLPIDSLKSIRNKKFENYQHEIIKYLVTGDYHYLVKKNADSALIFYRKAKDLSVKSNDKLFICESLKRMLHPIFQTLAKVQSIDKSYLSLYKKSAYDDEEEYWVEYYSLRYEALTKHKDLIKEFKSLTDKLDDERHFFLKARCYQFIGAMNIEFRKDLEIANENYIKAYSLYNKSDSYFMSKYSDGVLGNIARIQAKLGNYKEGINTLLDIISANKSALDTDERSKIYLKLSRTYQERNEFELANKFLNLRVEMDSIRFNERLTQLEIENKNFENQKRLKRLRTSILIISLFLALSFVLVMLMNKKRRISLQEKQLETQKNLTLLKEQEITTINAMVEGQEKERKRVAEDLHDNLGSVIATLKLHFENLRINRERKKINPTSLFEKTESLIDEAYQKVRNIAHAKNAGVIANQGLLVAVKLMAEKVSSANTLQIEVIDYGLENPIENSLEITLFRIIQELTTNIIKHAQASMVTINISQDNDGITILIEDNGIGMNTAQIDLKKGMGLHSIKTRVEHLDGSFTIDSTPTKGTTIIISIPSQTLLVV